MGTLQSLWSSGKCPGINGVMFEDDRVWCVEPPEIRSSHGETVHLQRNPEIKPIDDIDFPAVFISPMASFESLGGSFVALAGDGALGADGFVALTDLQDRVHWIAFFDFSNPFLTVGIQDGEVVARNNLGEVWHFPLSDPSAIRVDVPERIKYDPKA